MSFGACWPMGQSDYRTEVRTPPRLRKFVYKRSAPLIETDWFRRDGGTHVEKALSSKKLLAWTKCVCHPERSEGPLHSFARHGRYSPLSSSRDNSSHSPTSAAWLALCRSNS